MKGFLLSSLVFVAYVVVTALIAHIFRVERHSRLFLPALGIAVLCYLACYILVPQGMWFLPPRWIAHCFWLDLLLGLVILILNVHNYIDYFFGFNGGFSTSLMLLLYRAGKAGLNESQVISNYHGRNGLDKIYGWRLPKLEETGYIVIDQRTGVCTLTPKGVRIASLTAFFKKILNLGAGG